MGLLHAEGRFRRVKGFRQIPKLLAAFEAMVAAQRTGNWKRPRRCLRINPRAADFSTTRGTRSNTRQGRIYEAWMLDLSRYAGARRKRDLQLVQFWQCDSKDQLRKASLIYQEILKYYVIFIYLVTIVKQNGMTFMTCVPLPFLS
jgi:hypothetical protein